MGLSHKDRRRLERDQNRDCIGFPKLFFVIQLMMRLINGEVEKDPPAAHASGSRWRGLINPRNHPYIHPVRPTAALGRRDHRHHDLPFSVAQVARIPQPAPILDAAISCGSHGVSPQHVGPRQGINTDTSEPTSFRASLGNLTVPYDW